MARTMATKNFQEEHENRRRKEQRFMAVISESKIWTAAELAKSRFPEYKR
jgi:hypothetical protein